MLLGSGLLFAQEADFLIHPESSFDNAQNPPVSNDSLFDESEVFALTSLTNENFVASFYHTFDSSYAKLGYAFSFDQGQTWQKGVLNNPRSIYGYDPCGAINQYNEIFYSYIAYDINARKNFMTVARTQNFGATWEYQTVDSLPADKPWLAVDNSNNDNTNGNIYVSWANTENHWKMMFSKSGTDFHFSKPIILDSAETGGIYLQGVNMTVNENGILFVTYMKINFIDFLTGQIELKFKYSNNGGETFSNAVVYAVQNWSRVKYIGKGIDIVPLPSIASENNKVYVVIANPHQTIPKLAWSINLYSFDINNPTEATKDTIAGDSTNWYFYPSVVAKNNKLFIQYTSAKHDGHLYDLQQNILEMENSNRSGFYQLLENTQDISGYKYWTHHYNQVAVNKSNKTVYGVFTDYRNATNDIYFEKITPSTSNIQHQTLSIKTNALSQNYPNPFNPETTIRYKILERTNVKLEIYNMLGQRVAVLADKYQNAGNYKIIFSAKNLPSGIYFYKLKIGEMTEIKKMILLK